MFNASTSVFISKEILLLMAVSVVVLDIVIINVM